MNIINIDQLKNFDINKLLYPNIETTIEGRIITNETYRLIKKDGNLELILFMDTHTLEDDYPKIYDAERHLNYVKEECIKRFKYKVEFYKV